MSLRSHLTEALRLMKRDWIARTDDMDRRRRAGLLGRWPWQRKPNTRHIDTDMCCTEVAAEQLGRVALAETGAQFVVVHYRTPEGYNARLVVEDTERT